ncbi:Imm1 family immunity protein [Actinosynnema sp. NPDC047251]|uniref:Immunity protein Imm1 n=1 Tax=Saccharothrix espanaensis (strain ATCC 51144 / DSM 44229 / JCM 9112 / NBRC 15066 / NRRL 15764) TaxID=1179773 RepID=K0JTT1_SACES|nr:Imm1 family immunity protein [Saccharothrix espanaensis]CCH28932.1 hypothetical protein BN6_16090 [Saccharothrix espanaensis DSM 44229]
MATLKAIFDRETGARPVLIHTLVELDAFVERVRTLAVAQECPAVAEISHADNPWGHAILEVGIGKERGFVRENSTPMRATGTTTEVADPIVYDDQGTGVDIPAGQEVPLDVVRRVLAAFLAHDARIPEDSPDLHVLS